jgi:hypothetical protein
VPVAHSQLTTKLAGVMLVWSLLAASVLFARPDLLFG